MSEKENYAKALIEIIPGLTLGQLHWLQKVVDSLGAPHEFKLLREGLLTPEIVDHFGDALRIHHSFSSEPFTKDKFEHALVEVFKLNNKRAFLAPRGNPGHDVTLDEKKYSLKTQADKNLRIGKLWISKFMELGGGQWGDNPADLEGLLQQFLAHLQSYEGIMSLRALGRGPVWKYELVEIPKTLLEEAKNGRLEMKNNSIQMPKPGYCYVESKFDLYFDGGGERKLQIKNLKKENCHVIATWEFSPTKVVD
jgi:hypothetical protein